MFIEQQRPTDTWSWRKRGRASFSFSRTTAARVISVRSRRGRIRVINDVNNNRQNTTSSSRDVRWRSARGNSVHRLLYTPLCSRRRHYYHYVDNANDNYAVSATYAHGTATATVHPTRYNRNRSLSFPVRDRPVVVRQQPQ